MAQLVEHMLGKHEVPGPNPGSSSKKGRSPIGRTSLFVCYPKRKTAPWGGLPY